MRFILKSIIGLIGLFVVAAGATLVAFVGVVGVLIFKQAKLADGKSPNRVGETISEPAVYEPMSLEEIRAL